MDIKAAIQPVMDDPRAKALIARVTTEESKQAIAELYDMLPRPVRWVVKMDMFDEYVRQYVFREPPKEKSSAAPAP